MNTDTLYYTQPARHWMEALPLGNGSIGAMCYSGVETDEISLNHDTLWSGHPRTVTREGAYEAWRCAQRLALAGDYKGSQDEIEQHFCTCWSQAYLTFGSLKLQFDFGEYSGYQRKLDLSAAVLSSSFEAGGREYLKTAFVSYPHGVFVYRIEARDGGRFSFDASLDCPLKNETFTREGMLLVDGECPGDADTYSSAYPCNSLIYSDQEDERGILFRGGMMIDCDGTRTCSDTAIRVEEAACATLYFCIRTSYNGHDRFPSFEGKEYRDSCVNTIRAAREAGYEELLRSHIADHRDYYDRVSLRLGEKRETPAFAAGVETDASGGAEALIPTDERLKAFAGDPSDLSLYTLFFNYGRYLLIASSRPGSTAANLQGIWNNTTKAPWNSNYTVNINTQMNYWPALPCNMPRLMEPLVELLRMLSASGEQTARDFYHARGFVVHHNADIWGHTAPVYGEAKWAFWSGASGWLCQNLFDIYAYTLDQDFLEKTAFPIMKKAAEFYLDILVEDVDQSLMICPATSPENAFAVGDTESSVAKSTAMMNMIVLDLFTNCKRACEVLGITDSFYTEICDAVPRIKPLKIGDNGAILEWNEPLPETEVHHRHVSQLYALHPAGLIGPKDQELFEACRKTLELRGDDGTGWSIAWKVNFWARLRDGNHALKLLERQLNYIPAVANDIAYQHSGGTYPNLLDAHPPFQIDGNFGAVSGICEMLLQSDGEHIYLLPALPDKWKSGSVRGLLARGNVTVDMEWEDGRLTDYKIHGDVAGQEVVACR